MRRLCLDLVLKIWTIKQKFYVTIRESEHRKKDILITGFFFLGVIIMMLDFLKILNS